jgi:hypothetical protein
MIMTSPSPKRADHDRPVMIGGKVDGTVGADPHNLEASIRTIERAAGALATASVARMDDVLPWFRGLPADQRSWVMLVAQAGVRSFVEWLRAAGEHGPHELSDEIFDAAPRTLARSISLQHTVQLIKVTIDVVEEHVPRLAAPGEEPVVADRHAALLPRGGVQRRPGLRAGGRVAGQLGRPAAGATGRRAAAR